MEHPIVITNTGKIIQKSKVRKNLPYQGIARRALKTEYLKDIISEYDRSIDVSAMFVK